MVDTPNASETGTSETSPPSPVAPTPPAASEASAGAATDPAAPAPSLLGEKPAEAKPAEAKPEEGKAPEAKAAEETATTEPAPVESAPIEYNLTMPEGFEANAEELSRFTDVLREHHAPAALGQQLLEMYADEVKTFVADYQKQSRDAWDKTQREWADAAKADPEIGGNRYETVLKNCASVIDAYGGTPLREVLNLTGAGNHPEMFRFLDKIGMALGEGRPVPANAGPEQTPSRAQRRYNQAKGT